MGEMVGIKRMGGRKIGGDRDEGYGEGQHCGVYLTKPISENKK